MNKSTLKQQSGFTMIELVMVIVIMGILAAVALPKFVDLKGSGQTAALAGVQGSINSASTINYGEYYSTTPPGVKGTNLVGLTCSAAATALLQNGVLPTGYTVSNAANAAAAIAAAGTPAVSAAANIAGLNAAVAAATTASSAAAAAALVASGNVTAAGTSGPAGILSALTTTSTAAALVATNAAAALATANAAVTAASAADAMVAGDNQCTLTGPTGTTPLIVHIAA